MSLRAKFVALSVVLFVVFWIAWRKTAAAGNQSTPFMPGSKCFFSTKWQTYSFGNVMLIARQKPEATNVAGIRT